MNSSIQSIIDSALDGTLSTNSEVEHEASDGFKDSEIVKLAHALDFLGNNLDNIGTDEERLSDLQMLHEKVANETTALARIDPKMANPVAGTAFEAGKATGTKAGASSAGITQAVKNTWQGTGPKWTSAMGGHAGKMALVGGGLIGAGLAGKALFGKEGSYTDPSELSEAELIDYLGYDDAELYVLNKVAGVKGSSLHEVLLEKVAEQFGLDKVMGTINHYAGADKAGMPLPQTGKNRILKQLSRAAKVNPGLENTPGFKEMQKLVNSLEVGKPVSAATQAKGVNIINTNFDGSTDFEQAARAKAEAAKMKAEPAARARDAAQAKSNAEAAARNRAGGKVTGHVPTPPASGAPPVSGPPASSAPTPRQVTGQPTRMISGPTTSATSATPAATKATAAATPFYKNPKVIGGLAAAAGLGLAAKSVFGGNNQQNKTASYEGNDMSIFDEYDFSYLMTKEAGNELMRTALGKAKSEFYNQDPRSFNSRTRDGVDKKFAKKSGGRTYNARVAQLKANAAASGSGPRMLGVEGNYEIARRSAKSTAKKTRKAAKALEIGYTVDPAGSKALYKNRYVQAGAGLAALGGAYHLYNRNRS